MGDRAFRIFFIACLLSLPVMLGLAIYGATRAAAREREIRSTCALSRYIPATTYPCQQFNYHILTETLEWEDATCIKHAQDCYLCDGGEACIRHRE